MQTLPCLLAASCSQPLSLASSALRPACQQVWRPGSCSPPELIKKTRHLQIWVLLKEQSCSRSQEMEAPSVQQLQRSKYKAALTFWKIGHSHRSTQGLLSQRNHSGACQPSLRGLQGDLSWVASFSLNHKTARYKFSGIEKHLGF